jgi:hypothetical protein
LTGERAEVYESRMTPRALVLLPLFACSTGGQVGAPSDAGPDLAQPVSPDCTALGAARGPTQSCCPSFGIDACGAGLVCAALDGRTVPVCWAEGSRTSGQACASDALCVSRSCNLTTGRCRAALGERCTREDGCVQSATKRVVCSSFSGDLPGTMPYCVELANGLNCDPCERDADCVKTLLSGGVHVVGTVYCDSLGHCRARSGSTIYRPVGSTACCENDHSGFGCSSGGCEASCY